MVQGELISQGSRLKEAHNRELQSLLVKLQAAELRHKRSMTQALATELQSLREELSTVLETLIWARLRHVSHKFYKFGNKCGSLLARTLRRQSTSGHVHKLHTTTPGPPTTFPSKIADAFRDYYAPNSTNSPIPPRFDVHTESETSLAVFRRGAVSPAYNTNQRAVRYIHYSNRDSVGY